MSNDTNKESNIPLKPLKNGVFLEGPNDPDFNDYGFVSPETNDFYRKYMENASKAVPLPKTRRSSKSKKGQSKSAKKVNEAAIVVNKCEGSEDKQPNPKTKRFQTAAPIDFEAQLQLAEKAQNEPPNSPTGPNSPTRLLTAREKLEQEDRIQANVDMELQKPIDQIADKFDKTEENKTNGKQDVVAATSALLKADSEESISKIALEQKMKSQPQDREEDDDSDMNDFTDDSQPDTPSDKRKYSKSDMNDSYMGSDSGQEQQEDQEDMSSKAKQKKMKMKMNQN